MELFSGSASGKRPLADLEVEAHKRPALGYLSAPAEPAAADDVAGLRSATAVAATVAASASLSLPRSIAFPLPIAGGTPRALGGAIAPDKENATPSLALARFSLEPGSAGPSSSRGIGLIGSGVGAAERLALESEVIRVRSESANELRARDELLIAHEHSLRSLQLELSRERERADTLGRQRDFAQTSESEVRVLLRALQKSSAESESAMRTALEHARTEASSLSEALALERAERRSETAGLRSAAAEQQQQLELASAQADAACADAAAAQAAQASARRSEAAALARASALESASLQLAAAQRQLQLLSGVDERAALLRRELDKLRGVEAELASARLEVESARLRSAHALALGEAHTDALAKIARLEERQSVAVAAEARFAQLEIAVGEWRALFAQECGGSDAPAAEQPSAGAALEATMPARLLELLARYRNGQIELTRSRDALSSQLRQAELAADEARVLTARERERASQSALQLAEAEEEKGRTKRMLLLAEAERNSSRSLLAQFAPPPAEASARKAMAVLPLPLPLDDAAVSAGGGGGGRGGGGDGRATESLSELQAVLASSASQLSQAHAELTLARQECLHLRLSESAALAAAAQARDAARRAQEREVLAGQLQEAAQAAAAASAAAAAAAASQQAGTAGHKVLHLGLNPTLKGVEAQLARERERSRLLQAQLDTALLQRSSRAGAADDAMGVGAGGQGTQGEQQPLQLGAAQEAAAARLSLAHAAALESEGELQQAKAAVVAAEAHADRLKSVFRDTIRQFRETTCRLFGFRVDMVERRYTLRPQPGRGGGAQESLLFESAEDGSLSMLESEWCAQLSPLITEFLQEGGSIPAFLAATTLQLFHSSR